MGRKRTKTKLLMCLMAASTIITGILGSVPLSVKAADHEARIGDVYYEDIESAFQNVQVGETITVLKDCSVSGTLRVTRNDIILKSENADALVTVSRDEDFTGKTYGVSGGSVLLEVTGGSLTTRDIIFDGGAVLDDEFNNSGKTWKSALIYVDGAYTMESGTILQNNYVAEEAGAGLYTAGGLYVAAEGTLVMDGGIIQNCYTTGSSGGIQTKEGSQFTATAGAIRNCYGILGGGMNLDGTADLSGMTLSGNKAGSTGSAVYSSAPLTITDSLIKDNESVYDGGGIATATGHTAHITGCTFTRNTAARGSAIQTMKGEGTLPLVIRDCTFTGNPSAGFSHAGGVICYGNETGIVLSGKIVMEDNLTAGVEPCDIHYFYNTGASILLDEDFESDSTFVLGGYDTIKPGRVLIDGKLYHKDASAEQFVWHTEEYCTEKRGENIYLAEVPKTYTVRYDTNNDPAGTSIAVSDLNRYTSGDTAVIMDREALYSIIDTINFQIEGKAGSWLAFDSIRLDGREFFLMEHETYGKEAAWVVVDEAGKLAVDNVRNGFDQEVKEKLGEYLHPSQPEEERTDRPRLDNWQKYMENGEYLRSAEISEEQNYNMIDGRKNNGYKVPSATNSMPSKKKPKGRQSVLAKLHKKQAEIAQRSGKKERQQAAENGMERERK